MKTSLRLLTTVAAVALLVGCAHINKVMQSWVGHHYSELITAWGPPQQVFDDGNGGRILVYTATRAWVVPGRATTYTTVNASVYDDYIWGTSTSYTTFSPAYLQGYTAYRMFWISKSGYIYSWSWRGL